MSIASLVQALEALGFSLNESRAYAALLQESPATGYEVGARAQIPRSAVYAVLRRLVKVGAARAIAGTPERFTPAPPDEVLQLLRKRFEISTRAMEDAARTLETKPQPPDAFTVHGYDRVMDEADRLVRTATKQLVISGWPREIEKLALSLEKAQKRGVYIVVFSHSRLPFFEETAGITKPGEVFSYELPEGELEAFWKHRIIVVADDRVTLIGATEEMETDTAVVSETAAIAEVATSQIALDITLLAQRTDSSRNKADTREVMARMLGSRVGRLDTLLERR